MKKLLMPIAFISCLTIFSCNKTGLTEEVNVFETTVNQKITPFDLDVKIENGLLNFKSLEEFQATIESISDNKDRFISEEALNNWENRIGFYSMRNKFEKIRAELDLATDQETLDVLSNKYHEITFDDGVIEIPVANEVFASFLDEKGRLIMGNTLHCYTKTHQIVVLDKDESKLEKALISLRTDKDQGVFVFKETTPRGACGTSNSCSDQEGNRRIRGTFRTTRNFSPVYSLYFPIGFNYNTSYSSEVISERKGGVRWKRNNDQLIPVSFSRIGAEIDNLNVNNLDCFVWYP